MIGQKNDNHKFNYNLNLSYGKTNVRNLVFIPSFIQSTVNYLGKIDETLIKENLEYTAILVENTLNYDGRFGLHHINAVVGQTFQQDPHNRITGIGRILSEPYYLHLNNAADQQSESYEHEIYMSSYIGRILYDFDEKYLFTATVRRDASSQLAPDDNSDIFPSASAGWRIDRESFFPIRESLINLFKSRGSYGERGNISNLGPYDYIDIMQRRDYSYSFGNNKVTGSGLSNFVNTALRWEKKKTLDIGLDLAMFNNQLEFTFDWYKSTSEALHYDLPVPPQAGFTNPDVKMNAATIVNSGLEFLVAYHNDRHAVKFDISANLTTLSNKVTSLGISGEPVTVGVSRTEVGREVGSFYGYVY